MLLAGSTVERPPSVVKPSAPPSLGQSVFGPAPSPTLSTPSASLEVCLTDTVQVLSGDALPHVDGDGLEGLGESRGVYLSGRPPMLWAANPGRRSATLIASISPEPSILDVLDISRDGSSALIRIGNISPGGGSAECADLYAVRTDGSEAVRLTRFGTGRFVTGGAFSPDGRRIAFSWWEPGTITTLDIETGATIDQSCSTQYSVWPTRIFWSPSGDRIAVGCDRGLTTFDARGVTPPARFRMAGEPLAFSWTDDRELIVASGGGNIYSVDVSGPSTDLTSASPIVGRFDDPAIEDREWNRRLLARWALVGVSRRRARRRARK